MAKKAAAADRKQGKFKDDEGKEWDDANIPKPVQDAVDAFEKARRAKSRATSKFKAAEESAKSLMDKHGIKKVPYTDENGNRGWIFRTDKPELKSRKIKEPKDSGGED